MIRFTLIALAFFFAGSSTFADEPVDDSENYQLVFIGDTAGIARWFEDHGGLAKLASRCHVSHYKTADTLFRERYTDAMPPGTSAPAIVFARPDSGVIYCATRDTMPITAATMFAEMGEAYRLSGETGGTVKEGRPWRPGDRLRDTIDKIPTIRGTVADLDKTLRDLKTDSLILIVLAIIAALLGARLFDPPRQTQ